MTLKILLAIDEFSGPVAGTETQFWNLLNGLETGHADIGVLLLRRSEYIEVHRPDIRTYVMSVTRLKSLRSLLKALSAALWARREGYQVVHTFLNDTSILLPWVMRLVGLPIIVSRRDEGFWYTPAILRALRINRPAVSCVVANSKAVARSVQKAEGYKSSRIRVIYNGMDTSQVFPESRQARNEWDVAKGTFVFSVLANLRPLKRVDHVLRAFSIVRKERPETLLLIAGDDREGRGGRSHKAELLELAQELGILGSVFRSPLI